MKQQLLLDSLKIKRIIQRLCQQLVKNHGDFSDSLIIGLQPRGTHLANRIFKNLTENHNVRPKIGYLDITFHRDDFRRRVEPKKPSVTNMPFLVENKKVILIDDVLFTGRSVRAALDAMVSFGRPARVELLVLIDRIYFRDLPIEANYIGEKVNTNTKQNVNVKLTERDGQDMIELINLD